MIEHEIRADAARERVGRLEQRLVPRPKPRRRVRLTLGRWLIGGRSPALLASRAQLSRMKPCRAAETSATASGKHAHRVAQRERPALGAAARLNLLQRGAEVNSTAVFSVSVANCSRWASWTPRPAARRTRAGCASGLWVAAERESEALLPCSGASLAQWALVAALDVADELLDRASAAPCADRLRRPRGRPRPRRRARRGQLGHAARHRAESGSTPAASSATSQSAAIETASRTSSRSPTATPSRRARASWSRPRSRRRRRRGGSRSPARPGRSPPGPRRRLRGGPRPRRCASGPPPAPRGELRLGGVGGTRPELARELFAPLGPTYDRYASAALVRPGPALAAVPRLAPPRRPRRHRARRRHAARRPSRSSSSGRRAARSSASTRAPRCSPRRRRRLVLAAETQRVRLVEASRRGAAVRGRRRSTALTAAYLLRYVDDLPAGLRELARVAAAGRDGGAARFRRPARPGAARRVGALGRRRPAAARARDLARAGTRSAASSAASIRDFDERWPLAAPADALARSRLRGRGAPTPQPRRLHRPLGPARVTEARPAFYALAPGGWRDYVTLLHPPYTAWHLSYVAIGAASRRTLYRAGWLRRLLAFFLALGICAHALDELHGRPLQTQIPERVLVALTSCRSRPRVAIGIAGAVSFDPWLLVFVAAGLVARAGLQPRALRRRDPQRGRLRARVGRIPAADRVLRLCRDDHLDGAPGRGLRDADELRPARALDARPARAPAGRRGRRDDRAPRREPRAGRRARR